MNRSLLFALFLLLANVTRAATAMTPPLALGAAPAAFTTETRLVSTPDDNEISVEVFAAPGSSLFLWLPSEVGFPQAERETATRLALGGIEVWQPELVEARFLPKLQSSLDHIPAADVVALLTAAQATGKQVFLLSSGRGAIPALRGARAWRLRHAASQTPRGIILISPKFYLETPLPGEPAELMPIARASNESIFILQPTLSPWWWKLQETTAALESGGASVFRRALPEVRDRFYYRSDASPAEQQLANQLHAILRQSADLLHRVWHMRGPVTGSTLVERAAPSEKKDRVLRPYPGAPAAPPLALDELGGKPRSLEHYRGGVVLVNFWASWCPPCVHEMPSMQRLRERFSDRGFEIVAVNMAETTATIERFLRDKVDVEFPIWLDRDGAALKAWGVFAFPTSYLIGPRGNIRYAMFGAREWDEADVFEVVERLLAERP